MTADIEYEKQLAVHETGIAGLKILDLCVHGDARGWFKENWQREKMTELGIPDVHVVQNNISFNAQAGVTRGIHAEPWDKFISIATGSVFGAWVDLRAGSATFGKCFTCTLDPGKAIYVPRGVGNSFQALEDNTTYTYLVNAHWSAELKKTYTYVNLADPQLAIQWPIPLDKAVVSEADKTHPMLKDVIPMAPKRTLVTGCNGQLGHAIRQLANERGIADTFDFVDREQFDISSTGAYDSINWELYQTVINCGAYTAVDAAETPDGRIDCWKANAEGPALLARKCTEYGITLVHVSSDYVFDGTKEMYTEEEPFSPLGVYGQSKAAGDLSVAGTPKHYIVRSSWAIGEGKNFVKTMCALSTSAAQGKLDKVTVVNDQFGRLSFTDQIAKAIFWLLGYRGNDITPSKHCEYGTYNVTGAGAVKSWSDIAKICFNAKNGNEEAVLPVDSKYYSEHSDHIVAARPQNSALDLTKLEDTGFIPHNWEEELKDYISNMANKELGLES